MLPEKFKALDTDSAETKAVKENLKEVYDAAMKDSKDLFDKIKGFDPESEEGKKAMDAVFATSIKGMKIKVGEKDVDLGEAFKEMAGLQAQFDALSTKVNKADTEPAKQKTFKAALMDGLAEVKEKIDKILANGGRQDGPLNISVKQAVVMGDYNTIEAVGSVSHYSLTSDTGIVSTIRKRILTYLQNVAVGGLDVTKPYAMWIEELDEQGNPHR